MQYKSFSSFVKGLFESDGIEKKIPDQSLIKLKNLDVDASGKLKRRPGSDYWDVINADGSITSVLDIPDVVNKTGFGSRIQAIKHWVDVGGNKYVWVVANGKVYALVQDVDDKLWVCFNPSGNIDVADKDGHIKILSYLDVVFFNDNANNILMYNSQNYTGQGFSTASSRFAFFAGDNLYVRSFSTYDALYHDAITITGVNQSTDVFTVAGDQGRYFAVGDKIVVTGTNAGTYEVVSVTVATNTDIGVDEDIPTATVDGTIASPYRIKIEDVSTNLEGKAIYDGLVNIGYIDAYGVIADPADLKLGYCLRVGNDTTGFFYIVLDNGKNQRADDKCSLIKFNDRMIAQDYIQFDMDTNGEILSFTNDSEYIYLHCEDGKIQKVNINSFSVVTLTTVNGINEITAIINKYGKKLYSLKAHNNELYLYANNLPANIKEVGDYGSDGDVKVFWSDIKKISEAPLDVYITSASVIEFDGYIWAFTSYRNGTNTDVRVEKIDPSTNTIIQTVGWASLGDYWGTISSIKSKGDYIYFVVAGAKKIYRLHKNTYALTTWSYSVWINAIAIDNYIWAVGNAAGGGDDSSLWKIDLSTGALLASYGSTAQIHGIYDIESCSDDSGYIWCSYLDYASGVFYLRRFLNDPNTSSVFISVAPYGGNGIGFFEWVSSEEKMYFSLLGTTKILRVSKTGSSIDAEYNLPGITIITKPKKSKITSHWYIGGGYDNKIFRFTSDFSRQINSFVIDNGGIYENFFSACLTAFDATTKQNYFIHTSPDYSELVIKYFLDESLSVDYNFLKLNTDGLFLNEIYSVTRFINTNDIIDLFKITVDGTYVYFGDSEYQSTPATDPDTGLNYKRKISDNDDVTSVSADISCQKEIINSDPSSRWFMQGNPDSSGFDAIYRIAFDWDYTTGSTPKENLSGYHSFLSNLFFFLYKQIVPLTDEALVDRLQYLGTPKAPTVQVLPKSSGSTLVLGQKLKYQVAFKFYSGQTTYLSSESEEVIVPDTGGPTYEKVKVKLTGLNLENVFEVDIYDYDDIEAIQVYRKQLDVGETIWTEPLLLAELTKNVDGDWQNGSFDIETYEDWAGSVSYNPFTSSNVLKYPVNDIVVHKNRMILINKLNEENSNVLMYSDAALAEAIPPGNVRAIESGDGDSLYAGVSVGDFLYLFKANHIYAIIGDVYQGQLTDVSKIVGCKYKNAIATFINMVFFLNENGIHRLIGSNYEQISEDRLENYFDTNRDDCIDFEILDEHCWVVVDTLHQEVKWYVPRKVNGVSTGKNNFVIIYNIKYNYFKTYEYYSEMFIEEQIADVISDVSYRLMADYEGRIYKQTIDKNDDGKPIEFVAMTKMFFDETNIVNKIYKMLKVYGKNIDDLSVNVYIDGSKYECEMMHDPIEEQEGQVLTARIYSKCTSNVMTIEVSGRSSNNAPAEIEEIVLGYDKMQGIR